MYAYLDKYLLEKNFDAKFSIFAGLHNTNDVFSAKDLISKEGYILIAGRIYSGYLLRKREKIYFVPTETEKLLPFKIVDFAPPNKYTFGSEHEIVQDLGKRNHVKIVRYFNRNLFSFEISLDLNNRLNYRYKLIAIPIIEVEPFIISKESNEFSIRYTKEYKGNIVEEFIDYYKSEFEEKQDQISEQMLEFYTTLDKIIKIVLKKDELSLTICEMNLIAKNIIDYVLKSLEEEMRLHFDRNMLNALSDRISNLEIKNKRNIIKEYIKIYPGLCDATFLGLLLDKYQISYTYSEINSLIPEIKKELELEMFEQNLGNKKIEQIGSSESLNGYEFEEYLKKLFHLKGYSVKRTPYSGDQGADLIIECPAGKTVVQAKCQKAPVGNKAIQEVVASKKQYNADHMLVVCTSTFTKSAIQLAKSNDVDLWNGKKLKEVVKELNTTYNLKAGFL